MVSAGAWGVRGPVAVCLRRRGPWGACAGEAGAMGLWREGGRVLVGGHFSAQTSAALPPPPCWICVHPQSGPVLWMGGTIIGVRPQMRPFLWMGGPRRGRSYFFLKWSKPPDLPIESVNDGEAPRQTIPGPAGDLFVIRPMTKCGTQIIASACGVQVNSSS